MACKTLHSHICLSLQPNPKSLSPSFIHHALGTVISQVLKCAQLFPVSEPLYMLFTQPTVLFPPVWTWTTPALPGIPLVSYSPLIQTGT